jgi:hypothetical protein
MTQPTRERLAADLEKVPGMPPKMIQQAREGFYDDYLSPLAMPQIALVNDLLLQAKLPTTGPNARDQIVALVRQVMEGEYDGTKEEAREWGRSKEGRDALNSLIKPERN